MRSGRQPAPLPRASFNHQRLAPAVAGLSQQIVRRYRPPCARRIKLTIGQRFACPRFPNAIHNLPCGLDLVPADEERGVAGHGFEQEAFVSLGGVGAELSVVTEMHAHGANLSAGTGHFAVKPKGNAFVRLETEGQGIWIELFPALGGEEYVRGGPELNSHLAGAQRQILARAQEKRPPRPAPVVDEELQRHVSLHVGVRLDLRFLAIAGPRFAIYRPREVLPAHYLPDRILRAQRPD